MAEEKLRCRKCGRIVRYRAKDLVEPVVSCQGCGSSNSVEAKAVAKFLKTTPRKLRRVADLIRGKTVKDALAILKFTPLRAARTLAKVVKAASSNAESAYRMDPENLRVTTAMVDQGPVMKRWMPRAMGRASMLRKRTSHVTIWVREGVEEAGSARPAAVSKRKQSDRADASDSKKVVEKAEGKKQAQKATRHKTREKVTSKEEK